MTSFSLNEWTLVPGENRLYRRGARVDLQPRCADLLCYLARRPGQVVAREELLEEIWRGRVVGEDALNNCVRKLRRALGDDSLEPRFIETINGRGYRVVARVRVRQSGHRSPPRLAVAGLAVLAAMITLFFLTHSKVTIYRFDDGDTPRERQAKIERMSAELSGPGERHSVSIRIHDPVSRRRASDFGT